MSHYNQLDKPHKKSERGMGPKENKLVTDLVVMGKMEHHVT